MSSINAHRLAVPGILCTAILAGAAHGGGGQETETAYNNFPEVPSTWYVTGCCQGAAIADDIQVAPGTEGMQLAEVQMRLRMMVGQYLAGLADRVIRHLAQPYGVRACMWKHRLID